jgi:hypothetical protein
LEEEATRRQIADERLRLAAVEEAKQRRDEEVLAAQAHAQALRDRLAAPLVATAADVVRKPLPPPKLIGPVAPAPPVPEVEPEAAVPEKAPAAKSEVDTKPKAARATRLAWVGSNPRYVVGVGCVVGATGVAFRALFFGSDYSGHAFMGGSFEDFMAVLVTFGLLAPLFTRTVDAAAGLTTGVTIGYLAYLGIPGVFWLWGLRWFRPWQAYQNALLIVLVLMVTARVIFRRRDNRDTRSPRIVTRGRAGQVALAVVVIGMLVLSVSRWYGDYTDNHDSEYWVSRGAALGRVAPLLLVPVLLLFVWAMRRSRVAAFGLIGFAGFAAAVYFTAAFDTVGFAGRSARGEFLLAAAAAAAIVGIAVWRLHQPIPPETST